MKYLEDYAPFKDFPDERKENLRLIRATMDYGIACMLAFSFEADELADEELAWRIKATDDVLFMGLRN